MLPQFWQRIFLLSVMLTAPVAVQADSSGDIRENIHNFTQIRLAAGRCEKAAAGVAIQMGQFNKTDTEMVQFVLDSCKDELALLRGEYKKSNISDEKIDKGNLTEVAWLLGLVQGQRECGVNPK